jgi:hypothetical protein
MISTLVDNFVQPLSDAFTNSIVGGLVEVIKSDGFDIPVWRGGTACGNKEYTQLTPDSKASAVMFFELIGTEYKSISAGRTRFIDRFCVKIWYNSDKLGNANQIVNKLITTIRQTQVDETYFKGVSIGRMINVGGSVYDKYSLGEEKLQYNMHPFRNLVIEFDISYHLSQCDINITENNNVCS